MSLAKFIISAPLFALAVLALPTEPLEDRQCTGCTPPPDENSKAYCPVIDSEEHFTGDPKQIGTSVPAGDTINLSQTYTFGSSWSVGADLGLAFEKVIGLSAGLSAEVSQSVETGVTEGAEAECPDGGGWSCSYLVYPSYTRVKGHMKLMATGENCPAGVHGKEGKWEAEFPRKDKFNNAVWSPEICNCCNLVGNGDKGHPEKCCVDPCTEVPKKE